MLRSNYNFSLVLFLFILASPVYANQERDLQISSNVNDNLKISLLKLDKKSLQERKSNLEAEAKRVSEIKNATQNPHKLKKLSLDLKKIINELNLIEQILIASAGINIILDNSNDGIGLGAGNSSGGNSGTGTGTGTGGY